MPLTLHLSALRLVAGLAAAAGLPVLAGAQAPAAPADRGVTFVGAGDIAGCGGSFVDEATASLIAGIGGTVYTLGDNAYPSGRITDLECYDASWGGFRSRTRPAPGNHDYQSAGAGPYFAYFGSAAGPPGRGYYSFDLGGWHIVSLNSERDLAAQAAWLAADLAAHPARCTLAYWHKPLFTSGSEHDPYTPMLPIYQVLYDAGADLVLGVHNHQYERFAPQNPEGRADSGRGLRYFVVGTGGNPNLYGFGRPKPNSEVRYNGGHGVLKLTLFADRYEWEFVSVAGKTFSDRGSQACH